MINITYKKQSTAFTIQWTDAKIIAKTEVGPLSYILKQIPARLVLKRSTIDQNFEICAKMF